MNRLFILRGEQNYAALQTLLNANWKALAETERPLCVSIEQYTEKRSAAQNRRYWALLNEISEQAWVGGKTYSADAWHTEFAGRFIGFEETPSGHRSPISTTTLNVVEFGEYTNKIEVFAASDLGVEFAF